MATNDTITKLRPDRDLQCYFQRPSAVAALSETGPDCLTISGTWRQQFDWAVLEWNRDNVFEHPAFRNLPDGDLSGLTLQYEERRENCIRMDSDLYPTVDWPSLRIWASAGGVESIHKVPLRNYATPIGGSFVPASAIFHLAGTVQAGDYVGLAWMTEHHTYQTYATDTVDSVIQALVDSVNAFSPYMKAQKVGGAIQIFYTGVGQTLTNTTSGANGNKIGIYSYASAGATLSWAEPWQSLAGGTSPSLWSVQLPFATLRDEANQLVPVNAVRKMRWTYSADFQPGDFVRSEFRVRITNWQVTGTGATYLNAGGGRRIEDDSADVVYSGTWRTDPGNFSGGTISHTTVPASAVSCAYQSPIAHDLYLGTRCTLNSTQVTVLLDGSLCFR